MSSRFRLNHRRSNLLPRIVLLLFLPLLLFSMEFKVASYNVENLFDDVRNGTEYDEYIPGRHNWTSRMVDIKLNHTAEVICDLDADIIALQEIENEAILARLQKRLKRVGCAYRYSAVTHKRSSAIQVALMSRFPIIDKKELRVNYTSRDRDILEVTLRIGKNPLTLFVSHWKSKSRSGTESRRIVYAKALKKRIDRLPKGKEYIVLGDFNSHYDEYRVLTKRLNDTGGKTGINTILHTTSQSGRMLRSEDICRQDEKGLYNLWMELPPSRRWSHKFYGHKGAIDHILLPHSLFDGKGIDYVNHSFAVFKAPYLFTREGWINGWSYSGGKHKGRGYSDHLPVYARFSTDPYRPEKAERAEKDEKAEKVTVKKIEDLYRVEKLAHPVRLQGCSVLLKRRNNAIIKQSPTGRGIYLYGAARGLEEGKRYDLTISEIGTYKGLKEILQIERAEKVASLPLDSYYLGASDLNSDDPMLQNQIFTNLEGVYRDGKFEINGKKIRIYFKNRRWRPENGSRIILKYAHLGYYNRPQLVIYDKNDFFTVQGK